MLIVIDATLHSSRSSIISIEIIKVEQPLGTRESMLSSANV